MEAFYMFDKNKDEKINTTELGAVIRALGQNPTEAEIEKIMKRFDKDGIMLQVVCVFSAISKSTIHWATKTLYFQSTGNGFITKDEYLKIIRDHMIDPQIVEIKLREAFRIFDKNRDGSLDFAEMQKALMTFGEPMSEKECIELIKMADADKDGKVDVEAYDDDNDYHKEFIEPFSLLNTFAKKSDDATISSIEAC
ncbi:hypothetical protein KUTeg_008186 [Tegillarca granosa]|uniref:EF-hand domain-containing protein n=1 Tax=Tegillarca granosa TaxID=220873 RepID=A0ABQ9F8E6_TEGGR|nr:hypothetical protein KUTeg_008186 [Tegillarca granosa]